MSDWAPDIPHTVQSELPPFGIKPHWVTFRFTASANRLYDLYNAHVNRDRGDLIVWPTLDDLAAMMGLSRGDKVTPYMRELETGGAIGVRPVTNTGGKGRRYVITLKVHPPEGFAGYLQSSDWHEANRAGKPGPTKMAERARGVHPEEPAGGEVPPLEGVYVPPLNGGDVHPPEGVVTNNKLNQNNEEQPQTAPSARSAADVRRTTTGSSAREADSGCAATTETGPVAAEVVEPEEPTAGEAPAPEAGSRRERAGAKTGGRKPSPFPPEVRERIYATEAVLPPELRAALAAVLPHGHLPNANRAVIAQALQTREPAELGERAARRWTSYGYERDHHDGLLRSPIGVVEELLRPTPYCPDPECEDGTNRQTNQPCTVCETRVRQRTADRKAGRSVPTQRPPRLYRDREQCQVCDKPLPADTPADLLCACCRAELARAAAHLAEDPAARQAPAQTPADPHDDPHCAAPPSEEFRRYREEQAAAKLAGLARQPAPF